MNGIYICIVKKGLKNLTYFISAGTYIHKRKIINRAFFLFMHKFKYNSFSKMMVMMLSVCFC